jgi:hypothetical protein
MVNDEDVEGAEEQRKSLPFTELLDVLSKVSKKRTAVGNN